MDTRFWGPSGWRLLHLISFEYEYSAEHAITYAHFFETIPYILPCKFCRASLTDYYREHPYDINGQMNPLLDAKKWMFLLHNCVNQKLRTQELHPAANPTFSQVCAVYTEIQKKPWTTQLLLMWDFLFAVAYHHPKESFPSAPMPDCPPDAHRCKDVREKNKWNVLGWRKRMHWFRRFWVFLPAVLPVEIGRRWKEVESTNRSMLDSRRSTVAWLWRMRCGLDATFKDPYASVCKRIKTYSSDCGKKGIITCRRKRSTRSKRSKHSTHLSTRKHRG